MVVKHRLAQSVLLPCRAAARIKCSAACQSRGTAKGDQLSRTVLDHLNAHPLALLPCWRPWKPTRLSWLSQTARLSWPGLWGPVTSPGSASTSLHALVVCHADKEQKLFLSFSLPHVGARLAQGCFHISGYALHTHCSTPKMLLHAWHTALLDTQTHFSQHCAGIAQALEMIQYLALLGQFAQAQTALYCIVSAQPGQHCRTDVNDIPDLHGHPPFLSIVVFTSSKAQPSRSCCAALQHDFAQPHNFFCFS